MFSPEYACQLVLVMKLIAVFSASAHGTLGNFCGFKIKGCHACVISSAISVMIPTTLKISTAPKYRFQDISSSAFTPLSR